MGISSMLAGMAGVPPVGWAATAADPMLANSENWWTRISAARARASSGVMLPSVSISSVSLS